MEHHSTGPVCPQCGQPFSKRNLNPLHDLAYCDNCRVNYSYRELMAYYAASTPNDTFDFPPGTPFTYAKNADGTETISRKFLGPLLIGLLFLAGCAIVLYLALHGVLPFQYSIYSGAVALLTLVVAHNSFNRFNLDSGNRRMTFREGFKLTTIAYDDIAHIDLVQMTESDKSFLLRAVLKNGKHVDMVGGCKKTDLDSLQHFLERRCFAR